MSDLSAYGSSIQALREQAQSCRVSVAVPSAVVVTCGRRPSARTQSLPAGVMVAGSALVTLLLKSYGTEVCRPLRFLKTLGS